MTTPSTANYSLGKGILKFDRFDTDGLPTGLRDLGNAPAFTLGPVVEKLDHFSSRSGVKSKDKSAVTQKGLVAKFTLDEYDKQNLALALFGTVSGQTITLLDQTTIEGELRFFGDNEVGPNYNAVLWRVSLKPTSEVGFITDDWGKVEFEAEVLDDSANHPSQPFGYVLDVTGS